MAVIRKHRLYQLATLAWGVVVFAVVILTISGNARPFLAPDALPIDGPIQMVGVAVVLIGLGVLVIRQLEKRDWTAAGRRAGLTPSGGGGIVGKPDLVGTVEGREVRARTESRDVGGSTEGSSSSKPFTVVETDLAEPTERGLIVNATDTADVGPESFPADLSGELTPVGDVAVLSESAEFAREAVTPRAQDAVAALESEATVAAGPAANVLLEGLDRGGPVIGLLEAKLEEQMAGGPETVGTDREGVILDGADLEARARAVATVANGLEAAVGGESGN